MEEDQATIESQFFEFAKLFDFKTRSGETITLYHSDFWLRQASILDDRKVTMVDTGILFNKYCKSEIDFNEWSEMLSELCLMKELDEEKVRDMLTNCGLPGEQPVESFYLILENLSCPPLHDGYLCWPRTPAGQRISQHCPVENLSNPKELAYRICGPDGVWESRYPNETSPNGWTNFTSCFPSIVQNLFVEVQDGGNEQAKMNIATMTRRLEIVGYTLSFFMLIISLYIFTSFRALKNRRTLIHKHLFFATLLEILIRLILYADQAVVRSNGLPSNHTQIGIDNMPYICEGTYVLLEYATSVMFTWMLIEGIDLNHQITSSSLGNVTSYTTYCLFGWIFPIPTTGLWAFLTGWSYRNKSLSCWFGYNLTYFYIVTQGPRWIIIVVNMIYLGKILKVLVLKLKTSENTNLEKLRKTLRATFILLPLLGITQVLGMFHGPLKGHWIYFGIWSFSTHFLRSFQGVFIATVYCFKNDEVRQAIRKRMYNKRIIRQQRLHPPGSFEITNEARGPRHILSSESIPMTSMQWNRRRSSTPTANNILLTEAQVECQMAINFSPSTSRRALARDHRLATATTEQERIRGRHAPCFCKICQNN